MVNLNFKQIDLLRKRRGSSNLPDQYFIDTNKFIKKGIYSGLLLISISLILGIPFILRTKFLENQKDKIKPFTDEYDALVKKIVQLPMPTTSDPRVDHGPGKSLPWADA